LLSYFITYAHYQLHKSLSGRHCWLVVLPASGLIHNLCVALLWKSLASGMTDYRTSHCMWCGQKNNGIAALWYMWWFRALC